MKICFFNIFFISLQKTNNFNYGEDNTRKQI